MCYPLFVVLYLSTLANPWVRHEKWQKKSLWKKKKRKKVNGWFALTPFPSSEGSSKKSLPGGFINLAESPQQKESIASEEAKKWQKSHYKTSKDGATHNSDTHSHFSPPSGYILFFRWAKAFVARKKGLWKPFRRTEFFVHSNERKISLRSCAVSADRCRSTVA